MVLRIQYMALGQKRVPKKPKLVKEKIDQNSIKIGFI